jgi:hypothetical protein
MSEQTQKRYVGGPEGMCPHCHTKAGVRTGKTGYWGFCDRHQVIWSMNGGGVYGSLAREIEECGEEGAGQLWQDWEGEENYREPRSDEIWYAGNEFNPCPHCDGSGQLRKGPPDGTGG